MNITHDDNGQYPVTIWYTSFLATVLQPAKVPVEHEAKRDRQAAIPTDFQVLPPTILHAVRSRFYHFVKISRVGNGS